MRIREVIERLNAALEEYGNIPVTMSILGEDDIDANIEDIRADENSVTLYDK